jgi:DNA-binding MarR family transcriptional regulator
MVSPGYWPRSARLYPGGAMSRRPLPFDPVAEARRQWEAHGWDDAAPGMAAVTSLMRAQQIVLGRVEEVLRTFDLTFARYEVLMVLLFSRSGALPLSRLGDRLQVHPTSVTNAVDRLEATDLVRRLPHPSDRRTTLAGITDSGREVALAATEQLNTKVFADPGLDADGVDRLVGTLTEMRRRAGDF